MSITTMIVVIVALVVFSDLVGRRRRGRKRSREDERRDEGYEEMTRELTQLRERVETLERIVTDDRYGLNREFENLDQDARRSG